MNEQDSKILTEIQQTLAVDPNATQRTMAKNSNISLGMMNAVLKRCIERGWIAVQNLNMKKVCYCLTPAGFNEISKRSTNYMKHSFSMMNEYADKIQELIGNAKKEGKTKVLLYGKSNIQFVIEWACQKNEIHFENVPEDCEFDDNYSLCLAGECLAEETVDMLLQKGCKSIYDVVE